MAVKQLPKISDLPEPPDRLVGDQERFDVLTFNSLKAQKKMVNDDLNQTLIPALNQFAVDVNASVDAAALSERNAHDSEEVAKTKAGEGFGRQRESQRDERPCLEERGGPFRRIRRIRPYSGGSGP